MGARNGHSAGRDALAIALQIGQPVLLWGAPGEGKSAMITQVAEQLSRPCEVVLGSVREASDFAGLPMRVGDSVSFVPPLWATRCIDSPSTIVFFDELTTAAPSVQAAMLRVVLEREVGDLRLPGTVSIVAAANPPELSAGGDDLAAPLANRFCHLDWQADTAEWLHGMLRGWQPAPIPIVAETLASIELRWRSLLVGFITARPSILRQVPADVVSQGRAWPSPRSWDRAHRLAAACEAAGATTRVRHALVGGMVGEAAAIEFLRYAAEIDLPDPEALLIDPALLCTDVRADQLLASLAAVATAVAAELTHQRWEAAWEVLAAVCRADRGDLAAMAATDLLAMREPDWPAPHGATAFLPILREAELV